MSDSSDLVRHHAGRLLGEMLEPPAMTGAEAPGTSDELPAAGKWAAARRGDAEAWRELAGSFWYCVHAWWRRSGLEATDAGAVTSACFTSWIEGVVEGESGRLREWILARLAELSGPPESAPEAAPFDLAWAEATYAAEPDGAPDDLFQRRWAITVLEQAMAALRAEYEERGQSALYEDLTPFAGFDSGAEEHTEEIASRHGLSVGAVRKAVFDFRTRQRELLRAFVGDTVVDPSEIDSEMTALLIGCDAPGPAAAEAPLPTAIRRFKPDELLARAMQSVRMTSGGAGAWTPPSDAEVARLFPQYEMHGMLGRGGMGAVYRGHHPALDRDVAIKLLPLEVSVDEDFAGRFVREARAMAKLSHPNIIHVYDFGTTSEGHLFFVMEFIEGANLADMIHGPGLSPEQSLGLAGQVCTALAYAHGKGVVHRDIKPANVMVSLEGVAKVADFGLARLTDSGPEQLGHTVTGMVMGTPDYMAPEQKKGMAVDHRADIFSVGVMIYEMLCGETPQGAFEPPSQRVSCDARLDRIVMRAMHRDPERRYQSTTEMRADLEAVLTPQSVEPEVIVEVAAAHPPPAPARPAGKKPAGLFIGIAAVVVALAGAGVFLTKGKLSPQPASATHPPAADSTAMALQTIDLLALVDPVKDRVGVGSQKSNVWEKAGGILRYHSDGGSGKILAPVSITARRYEFQFDVARVNGSSQLNLGLPLPNGSLLSVVLLDPGRKIVDDKSGPEWPDALPDKGRMLISYEAASGGDLPRLRVVFNGQTVADLHEEFSTWAKSGVGYIAHRDFPGRTLPSLYCKSDSFDFSSWKLRVFEGSAKVLRAANLGPAGSAVAPATAQAAPAPAEASAVFTFGGHRYQFLAGPFSKDEAAERADSLGGHLVTITSAAEQAWIEATFAKLIGGGMNRLCRTGGRKAATDSPVWTNNEPWSYTNWDTGYPKKIPSEVLVFLFQNGDQCPWRNRYWSQESSAIVEWDDDGAARPATPSASAPAKPGDVLTFGGHRYQLVAQKLNWEAAKAQAEAMGGHLATVNSKEENEWIQKNMKPPPSSDPHFYIGGSHDLKDHTDVWKWVTGEPVDMSLWGGKGPDSPDGTALTVVAREWDDTNKHNLYSFLVEWDDDTIAKPAGAASPARSP